MQFQSTEPPLIVWVDHDKTIKKLIGRIGEQKRSRGAMTRLDKEFKFECLIVSTGAGLVERTITKLKEAYGERVAVVLVDCTFGIHTHHEETWKEGVELATGLRERLGQAAVGIYSRFKLKGHQRAMISTKHLDIVLDELNQVSELGCDLSPDDLFGIFGEAIRTSQSLSTRPLSASSTFAASGRAKWADGQPECSSPSFRLAALKLAEQTLSNLGNVPEIILTQIGGGFSGSFVVRAVVADRNKSFIIKIDENPERLKQELLGYKEITGRVNHDFWLPLFSDLKFLLIDHWGAFAMQYESNATPLIDHPGLAGTKLVNVYSRLWKECLDVLYDKIEERQYAQVEIVRDAARASALKAIQQISRYKTHVSSKSSKLLGKALKFLEGGDCFSFKSSKKVKISWATLVHGDLNCRNVFFDDKRDDVRIIDFPNVKANFLPTDYAKAEAELILVMMDWATGRDVDFGQLDSWKQLTGAFAEQLVPKFKHIGSPEITRIGSALSAIRSAYARKVLSISDSSESYCLCLIARLLPYLSYSDITPAKRFLALIWIGQLLTAMEP